MNIQFNLLDYSPQDGGILDIWLDYCSNDWLFVTGRETWYRWSGTHWQSDDCQQLQKQILTLMDAMNKAAKNELKAAVSGGDEVGAAVFKSWLAATKRTRDRVNSVRAMAQAHRAVSAATLDAGNVLNLKNGTLDLDTLTLQPHNRDDCLTYCLSYEYDTEALAPRWEKYVSEVLVKDGTTETDEDLCMLFKELLGYSLTNDTKHETMVWLSGGGGNGKTKTIEIIQSLLGPMSCSVDFQTLGLPGNYDLAGISGRRVIFSTESDKGGKAAESYIKRIVSGERINARAIYGSPFEFTSRAKIWWAMNDRPVVKDTGNAIWRRMKLIPFNREFTVENRDTELIAKLQAELPGILNYAISGLRQLRTNGRFTESTAVKDAIEEYRHESNPVAQWLDENTKELQQPLSTSGKTLYLDYELWCKSNGRQQMNSVHWGRELKRLKVSSHRTQSGQSYARGLLYTGVAP